jgi:hypothetical protein
MRASSLRTVPSTGSAQRRVGWGRIVTAQLHVEPVPRLALRPGEAAAALGVSDDFFAEHVAPHLKWIYVGHLRLVATDELRESARRNGERVPA